jgi:predicted PurR-regulated permease PerM
MRFNLKKVAETRIFMLKTAMEDRKSQLYYLLVLTAGALAVLFLIFRPFIYPVIFAAVLAVVFEPVHKKVLILTRSRRGLAALITSLIIAVLILLPVVLLGIQVFNEARQLYISMTEGDGKINLINMVENILTYLRKYIPAKMEFKADFDQYVKDVLGWLIDNIGSVFSNIVIITADFFIFIIALYYMLKEGSKLKDLLTSLSPLQDADEQIIFSKLESSVNSVIKGNLTIALIQGAMSSAGFFIFGVPNAVLWGSVTAVAALIPGVGTSLVLIPAIIFLFLKGNTFSVFGLLAWGGLAVGLVDNLLGPRLVGTGMKMHPFVTLLSVLGGIGFFGLPGFLLGPVTVSLFFAFLEIYSSIKTRP